MGSGYPWRSATRGSTAEARRDGNRAANDPVRIRRPDTPRNKGGFRSDVSKSRLETNRDTSAVETAPAARPIPNHRSASFRNSAEIIRGEAPTAIRTPISVTLCATKNDVRA